MYIQVITHWQVPCLIYAHKTFLTLHDHNSNFWVFEDLQIKVINS